MTKAHDAEAIPADPAFGAARAFVEHLAMVAQHAREYRPHPDKPDAWRDVAFYFAEAFIAWYDLTHLLTPTVRSEARRVYPPGAASIKLGTGGGSGTVGPALPANAAHLLTAYRRVELDATPYSTAIEAMADGLGVYFRNAVYPGRRHPLEPDTEQVRIEAKALATARQVAEGKPAEPFGWGADYDELMKLETRVAVRARLGIKTYGDVQDLMMREWKAQDRERGEWALRLLRCDPINFPDLRMQLLREAEAVIAVASALRRRDNQAAAGGDDGHKSDTSDAGDGDSNRWPLHVGTAAIDEDDVALLEFLNRTPGKRRKVSDVIPAKGPQDRKAVAKRLRRLADRPIPLVDYPKGGRSGVVILPAGAEALQRATAPTPP